MSLMKITVNTPDAPKAIGPYSQAVKAGNLIFCSGQIPIDPATSQFVEGGIAEQTERAILNLKAVLEAGGSKLGNVVKTTVLLKNMAEFAAMNEVYGRYFAENPPARAAFEVARLPKDALVEIEAIAVCD